MQLQIFISRITSHGKTGNAAFAKKMEIVVERCTRELLQTLLTGSYKKFAIESAFALNIRLTNFTNNTFYLSLSLLFLKIVYRAPRVFDRGRTYLFEVIVSCLDSIESDLETSFHLSTERNCSFT